ncbi:hypothetical protein RB614_04055 [Phytohabitans sp. ZYX-F-186]|uniref:Esterase Ig-like N-terminal domain-containing protein n=1 Tax=Phytohabitans maris TaxID=3071409 RepID=A0ABU0Z9I0_9ACTN|nr:hypothetical protein [Phytohabitans sp. ZYX-F-186]MDQ7903689.1 hypothetical protein [Phytohabitans sp. ZYX-F-186]
MRTPPRTTPPPVRASRRQILGGGAATAAVLVTGSLATGGPAAATPAVPVPLDATLFVQVEPVGARVTTVVVEYSRPIVLRHGTAIDPAAFEVVATLAGNGPTSVAPRTVTRAYTAGEAGPSARPRPGRFLVLKLDIADANSAYAYSSGDRAYPLDGAYQITQTGPIAAGRGHAPVSTASAQAAALWRQAVRGGGDHLFTTYPAGTTPVSGHHSWIPTYSNPVVLDWLFSQRRSHR